MIVSGGASWSMRTMPGLGATPAFMQVDIDDDGEVVGLF